MKHPYIDLPDHQLWPSAMTTPAPGHINPALEAKQKITNKHQIATMGSCFAQHLAKQIRFAGFNYLVTEKAPDGTDPFVAIKRNFGMFSARYGNVYTPRQAVQLFDRAFSRFVPAETFWENGDRYLDPFRPGIEPEGFLTREELAQDVGRHLACVREVFLKAHWFIFTLGLTEAWRSKLDGAVYPIAPGLAGGIFSLDNYEFINFSVEEVSDDISRLRNQLYEVNPAARMILTVSPVPLVATYENRHVWVSTTYSKAVLRVAAEQAVRHFDNVEYFPSYEVITSPAAGFRYFDDDLRSVTEQGVKHVMRVFFRNYCETENGGDTSILHPARNQPWPRTCKYPVMRILSFQVPIDHKR